MQTVNISLRNYFAAAALQGLLADPNTVNDEDDYPAFVRDIAESAYGYADAMLRLIENRTDM